MELRNPDTPVNEQRGRLVGAEIVEVYSQKKDPIMSFDPESRGQLQLVLNDMMFQLTPEDAIKVGLRMEMKEDAMINDLTVLGELVGGQAIFEYSGFAEARDFEFMRSVLKGIIKEFKDRVKYAIAADHHVRGRDEIIKD